MFMRIVQRVNGLIMAQYIRASMWVKERLLQLASKLLASITRVYQNVANLQLLNLLRVPTGSSTNPLRVSLTTAGQLIKAALISAKAKVILLGKQLLTTVRQISQAALTAFKQTKDKLVELIKLVPSRLKENKTVQTLTVRQLIQAGSKLAGLAKQLPQRVRQVFKKGQ
jgi:hypothetical protein